MKRQWIQIIGLFLILGSSCWSVWFAGSIFFEYSEASRIEDNIGVRTSNPNYWPISGWRSSVPEEQGVSSQKLNEMEDYIENQNLRNYIDSILIVRNGYLVYEWYPSIGYNEDIRHHIFSCTKVFTSALIGIAIEEGYIGGVDDYVLDYFPNRTINNLDARKEAMTIRHLLTMTSGLEWNDNPNFYQMEVSSNWAQYVLDRPMEFQPGTVWNYNTGCSHLLSVILNEVTPYGTRAYAIEKIFNPLNITNYIWNNDAQGIPIGGTQLFITPRDMAKFGYLYLKNGYWNGTQLIPSNWVVESRTAVVSFEFEQGHGSGYGYQWWTYNLANGYAARGSNQQHIYVIPDLNLVVVSTGNTEYPFINLLVDYILPSAGFSPINLMLVISLIVFLSTLGAYFGYKYYKSHTKKKSIQESREQDSTDTGK